MKIALGADHAGYPMKEYLARFLREKGFDVEDFGTHSEKESVDYPDFAAHVARSVIRGDAQRGVIVCGTGIGVAIAANKIDGIRAATCNDLFAARMCRAHNDVNVLTLGGRVVGQTLAEEIVQTFLETEWDDGRHRGRVEKIHALE